MVKVFCPKKICFIPKIKMYHVQKKKKKPFWVKVILILGMIHFNFGFK